MQTDRFTRFLPIAGILAGILFLVALGLSGSEPDGSASQAKIVEWYADNNGAIVLINLVLAQLFAVLLLFFVTGLRAAIRSGEAGESTYSTLLTLGGTVTAVAISVGGVVSLGAAEASDKGADANVIETLHILSSYSWAPWAVGTGVLMIGTGLGGLRTAALPRALSWISLVVGLIAVTPLGVLAYFVMPFWLIATGAVLARRATRPAAAAQPGYAQPHPRPAA